MDWILKECGLRALIDVDKKDQIVKNIASEIESYVDIAFSMDIHSNLDRYTLSVIEKDNINLFVIDKKYEDFFVEDIFLRFKEVLFLIVDQKTIRIRNCDRCIKEINYVNVDSLMDEVLKIRDDIDLRKEVATIKFDYLLEQVVLARLTKNINKKIIKIGFNEEIYFPNEIKILIEIAEEIIDSDEKLKDKKIIFDNTKKVYKRKEVKVVNSKFKELSNKYNDLNKELRKVVVGQDLAIDRLVNGLFDAEMNPPAEGQGPLGCFFLFGPPGTGKTFLVENSCKMLGYEYEKFHMEEYAMSGDEISLIGSDRQWKNARRGDLVNFIDRQESTHIVVFDEFEKANLQLLTTLLSLIGNGMLHDMYNNTDICANKTILIFTSNCGKELFDDSSIDLSNIEVPLLLDALKKEKRNDGTAKLSPEFCSRIMASNVIVFNNLSVSALSGIINNSYKELIEKFKQTHKIKLNIDNRLSLLSIFHTGKNDARIANNFANDLITNEIYKISRKSDVIDLDKIESIRYKIDFSNTDKEIKSLFINNKRVKIGVVGDKKVINYFDLEAKEYEVVSIRNEEDLNSALKNNLFAYFIDPFFGGIKNDVLSITDYNTDGINFLYKINETNSDIPIYIVEKDNIISNSDEYSLLHDGVKRILFVDEIEGFREDVLDLIDTIYLENKANEISQKGWIVDFKTRQELSDDATRIDVIFNDFKKYMAYDVTTSSLMVKQADIPEERFEDVIGCNEAKEELKYYIQYLKDPVNFVVDGAKLPKGVLLFGPPGTGKTMLARAMAGESGVNFISTTAADLLTDPFVNGEAKIRNLFARARKYAPTIIFIDEIDAVGRKRNGLQSDSVLTALLTEMDGFNKSNSRPVFVLAATNYGTFEINNENATLDQALLRRFDSNIYVGLPDSKGREKYINLFLEKRNIKGIKKETIDTLVSCSIGQSLAILENILELAFRNSIRKKIKIDDKELLNALDQYQNGEIKEVVPEQAKLTAVHEAGHAVAAAVLGQVPAYITIESRGNYGGYVAYDRSESYVLTRDDMLNTITISLAGRVSQEILIGKQVALNTGASDDLRKATAYAFDLICSFGMEGSLLTLDKEKIINTPLADEYMIRANEILDQQYEVATKIIKENKKKIKKVVEALLKKGHLTKKEFLDL